MRPSRRAPLAAIALSSGALLLATASARADDDPELEAAVADFQAAEKALTATTPCDTMCKALQSMSHAADRICELAREGSATDQKRCTDAKTKVAEATARVRASCPNCDPSPPYAPSTTPGPKPAEAKPEKPADMGAKTPVPPPAAPREELSADYAVAGVAKRPTSTVSLDIVPLFAPPWVVEPRFERSASRRFSFALRVAFGSLPKTGPAGSGRTGVFGVGGEARAYLFGSFDRFGVFVGADLMYRSANQLSDREYLLARAFPLGLTASALVGTKLVFAGGLTLEARVGPSFVIDDARVAGPREKVLPAGGISLGWTF